MEELKEILEKLQSYMIDDNGVHFGLTIDQAITAIHQLIFEGLPKKLKPEEGLSEVNWDYCIGFNFAHAEIIKYLESKLK